MIGKRIPLAMRFCALLLVGLPAASYANTLQLAECSGGISEDGVNNMSVYVLAEKTIYTNPATPPQIGGQICLAGRTGALALTANAVPSSVNCSSFAVSGVTYDSASVTTKPFSCLNLNTGVQTQAWMTMSMTTTSSGLRSIGFQVFAVANGALLAETVSPRDPQVFDVLPLSYGLEMIEP